MAKESGIAYTTINDICSGKAQLEKCSAETIYRISKVLDVSMESLIEPCIEERSDFELFKSNTCHTVIPALSLILGTENHRSLNAGFNYFKQIIALMGSQFSDQPFIKYQQINLLVILDISVPPILYMRVRPRSKIHVENCGYFSGKMRFKIRAAAVFAPTYTFSNSLYKLNILFKDTNI